MGSTCLTPTYIFQFNQYHSLSFVPQTSATLAFLQFAECTKLFHLKAFASVTHPSTSALGRLSLSQPPGLSFTASISTTISGRLWQY